jgi:hypothetical protein
MDETMVAAAEYASYERASSELSGPTSDVSCPSRGWTSVSCPSRGWTSVAATERHEPSMAVMARLPVAPRTLFVTLGGILDGNCLYCNDRSAGAPTLLVSWTQIPSVSWFFLCSFSFSCCQYLVLDVIPLFNVDCHRLRSCRVTEGLFP